MLTLVVMTNITDKQTNSEAFKRSEKQLAKIIGRLKPSTATDFLQDFLTESEKIMLTKRFGAVFLIHNRYSAYKVAQLLGLSEPTVARIKEDYALGKFDSVIALITKKEGDSFLNALMDFALSRIDHKARHRLVKRSQRNRY